MGDGGTEPPPVGQLENKYLNEKTYLWGLDFSSLQFSVVGFFCLIGINLEQLMLLVTSSNFLPYIWLKKPDGVKS